ncbi:carbohydrate-binding domain-containing protein [Paenibacillus sp. M1]|uniref:Carbohydrate-binding domain-containing protein n=1 Tax=Paenibacillus haidiansis TaxID=1574488 RepID=A0ABU7VUT0_9BACL
MKNSYNVKFAAFMLLSALLASGCSANAAGSSADTAASSAENTESNAGNAATVQLAGLKPEDLVEYDEADTAADWSAENATSIALNGAGAVVDGPGAAADGGVVTISAAGTYVLSGKLDDGGIVIDAGDEDFVRLVLNGVQIHNADSSAIYIKGSGKTVLTLADGTENTISDGEAYTTPDTDDEELTAAIYSKSDLTINGTGKLSVQANYKDGITGKDDLKIVSGTLDVTAADDGIVGRDLAAVKEGSITIKADGDAIKTTNDTDADKGYLVVEGGTFDLEAENDGLQAASALLIAGGSYDIMTGGGSANGASHEEENRPFMRPGSDTRQQESGDAQDSVEEADAADTAAADGSETETDVSESDSAKGLKATVGISITDGTFKLDSADDALHSNGSIHIAGGQLSLATGDDAIHADEAIAISGGTIDIAESYEGIESADIAISGGEVHVVSSDDGFNASGGTTVTAATEQAAAGEAEQAESGAQAGGQGRPGGGGPGAATDAMLSISGGYVTVDAGGDGLDSNGSIVMSGGTVLVNGPTNGGNGSLDYDGTFEQSGGLLIAAGSSGMAQAPSESSSQRSVMMTFPSTLEAGTLVTLTDSAGTPVLSFAPAKSFQTVVISSPDLKAGETYAFYTGGTATGEATDGLYEGGKLEGGTKVVGFTLDDTVTYVNESGVTTGGGGFGGGFGGGGRRGMGGGQSMELPVGNEPSAPEQTSDQSGTSA